MLTCANQGDWAQRYRPQKLEDMVLPPSFKQRLIKIRDGNSGPSLLLHGRAGTGKTTVAELINPENTHKINCSIYKGINDIRELQKFRPIPLFGGRRVIVLDEADALTTDAQAALRGLMEDLSTSSIFVLTANYPDCLLEPLRSRVSEIDFNVLAGNQAMKLAMQERVREILANEGIDNIDDNVIRAIVENRFPDMRRILKDLQYQSLGN
jgi:replication factor C small subunit